MPDFLSFCGSARRESLNQQALNALSDAVSDAGGTVTPVSLAELDIPLYHGDLEAASGLPPGAARLQTLIKSHDGLLIGCPEYNGYMTPLLLNALDWATRSAAGVPDLSAFGGKLVLISGTSPGVLGGMRAARELRTFLSGIGAFVMPQGFSVPKAGGAFEAGKLVDERSLKQAKALAEQLLNLSHRLSRAPE